MGCNYTINGRPWGECLAEIRKYKRKSNTKKGGNGKEYGYFTIDEYFQRLDEVIGSDHYTVENEDFQRIRLDSGQEMLTVRCRISILDDEGRTIVSKSAYGGTEIQYAKATGRDTNIGNAPGNACKDAFKAAAELFGILGYHGYRAENAPSSSKENPPAQSKDTGKKDTPMNLISEGKFFDAGERDGHTIWKLAAHEKVDARKVRAEIYELIFYPNQVKKDAEKFNQFFQRVDSKATPFKALVQSCGERAGKAQYIFKGFCA